MTAGEVLLDDPSARRMRMLAFLALLASMAVMGVLSEACTDPRDIVSAPWWAAVFLPAYVLWVVSDCQVRGAKGWLAAVALLLAFVPACPALLYFVWTRRLQGLVAWLAFWIALLLPFWLTSTLAHGVFQIARGQRW